ncbi:hypothetical protein J0B03_05925 [Alkalibacter rhizosphaerae]|uniref:Uncharacterized protein n=1 Tax=Alkalibacter rhizosphaerae TaxID=2815577 RepID=A0A975AJC6_9FIRM|nr:hypothetical protein [Alkalibacter rhizosphaerae]QSX09594.1 hypothetical protein J0B03_05925 [Alkalibacter rhizosphaerae]
MKVYSYPFTIAYVNKDDSTWFRGYDERYFFDNGAWLQTAFPLGKHWLVWYFVWKFSKKSTVSKYLAWRLQVAGIQSFDKGLSYEQWSRSQGKNAK